MKIGFSAANITPSYGMERPGGTGKAYHQGIHDDCLASACVLDDGDNSIAVCGLDSLSVKHSVCEEARGIIQEAVGIPPEHVMFGASHTHSGGPATQEGFASEADRDYLRHMSRQMATAVIDAHRRREELLIGVGVGRCEGVAHHRRWIMKDGTQRSHPGRTAPDQMDRPHGELDPEVGVIGVGDREGSMRGCIVNFTCHGTTGLGVGGVASSDWIHYLRATLKDVFGEEFGVVFLNGACGDITQVDNTAEPDTVQSGPLVARRVGMSVAGEALKVLVQMELFKRVRVAGKRTAIMLQPREITEEMLEWAKAHLDSDALVEGRWFADRIWAREWIEMARMNQEEPEIPAELQALTIGGAAVVSTPAEYFCALGLDIKRRSKFQPTFVVELANGSVGYVGPEDAYADGYIPREGKPFTGGYETTPARSSKVAAGTGEQIADACVELVNSMTKPRRSPF
jgi:neutral ceramidase